MNSYLLQFLLPIAFILCFNVFMDGNIKSPKKVNFLLIFAFVGFLLFDLIILGIYFKKKAELKPSEESEKIVKQVDLQERPSVDTSGYEEYLEKYPQNITPFNDEIFNLFGRISKIADDYLLVLVDKEEIKLNYSSESGVVEIMGEGSGFQFTSSLIKENSFETFLVKKTSNGELFLVAFVKAE